MLKFIAFCIKVSYSNDIVITWVMLLLIRVDIWKKHFQKSFSHTSKPVERGGYNYLEVTYKYIYVENSRNFDWKKSDWFWCENMYGRWINTRIISKWPYIVNKKNNSENIAKLITICGFANILIPKSR